VTKLKRQRVRLELKPLPITRAESAARILDAHRRRFEDGNAEALLDAIGFCGERRMVQPDWVVKAFQERWKKWRGFEVRTLDEAFRVSRPKGRKLTWLRTVRRFAYEVLLDIADAKAHGRPVNVALYEEIGERYGLSGTTVDKLYREARKTAFVLIPNIPK
jgi:hypothetical protein